MSERIDAVFDNGVFRPEVPVNMPSGQRVSLTIELGSTATDDLELRDLLDTGFMESCRQPGAGAPSLDAVRQLLSAFEGSLAERIVQERDDR